MARRANPVALFGKPSFKSACHQIWCELPCGLGGIRGCAASLVPYSRYTCTELAAALRLARRLLSFAQNVSP